MTETLEFRSDKNGVQSAARVFDGGREQVVEYQNRELLQAV